MSAAYISDHHQPEFIRDDKGRRIYLIQSELRESAAMPSKLLVTVEVDDECGPDREQIHDQVIADFMRRLNGGDA